MHGVWNETNAQLRLVKEGATLEQSGENEELDGEKNQRMGTEKLMMRKKSKDAANRVGRCNNGTGQRENICNRMTQLRGRCYLSLSS